MDYDYNHDYYLLARERNRLGLGDIRVSDHPFQRRHSIIDFYNPTCVMYLSDIKSCIHRGAILIRWGAILIRWGAILIRRGARCSSMLWTLCEVSSFPRVCLCWQLLASVLLASVLLPINLILLCIYLTLNLVFPVLIRRGAIHIHRGAILIRRGTIGAQ